MKNFIVNTLTLLLLLSHWACEEPPVVFREAQPQGYDNEAFIAPIYQGTFFCESDSSVVYMKNRTIYKEKRVAIKTTLEELNFYEELKISGDSMKILDYGISIPIKVEEDSVSFVFPLRDTLFQKGPKQQARLFKGHLLINRELRPNHWEVLVFTLDQQRNLVLSRAFHPVDLERLIEVTPVETNDFEQFRIAPSPMALDQILKEQLVFEACDYFRRVQQPVFL